MTERELGRMIKQQLVDLNETIRHLSLLGVACELKLTNTMYGDNQVQHVYSSIEVAAFRKVSDGRKPIED
jgi:hypothetical protein